MLGAGSVQSRGFSP